MQQSADPGHLRASINHSNTRNNLIDALKFRDQNAFSPTLFLNKSRKHMYKV
ncbi:hypothetical protein FC95_GL001789 [Lentilactobacillus kefiri DSM 20587 = JCM 5818]|uniref:Uncharacterized protein n=1 Tax=Lentilactobacillus kefiri DSM 20587 = JCM 5818 TaxID=1423764 RepID=A0A8E1RKS5_LENKE|nr:hypothetical protein FC95_GL001789 [Lentilactobacillus kefiri DSM 20587 = JCM 5818]